MNQFLVAPVTVEEALLVLLNSPTPLSAEGVANKLWRLRGTNTVSLHSPHVKPVLQQLVEDELAEIRSGDTLRDTPGIRGASSRSMFYILTEKGRTQAEEVARQADIHAVATALADQLKAQHSHRVIRIETTPAGAIQVTLTPNQAASLFATTDDRSRDRAMRSLVDNHYDGNWTRALLSLARTGQIAVAWLDRRWFTDHLNRLGVTLTDDKWHEIVDRFNRFENFDEFVDNAGWSIDYAETLLSQQDDDLDTTTNHGT